MRDDVLHVSFEVASMPFARRMGNRKTSQGYWIPDDICRYCPTGEEGNQPFLTGLK
jgi:hypothetical protein